MQLNLEHLSQLMHHGTGVHDAIFALLKDKHVDYINDKDQYRKHVLEITKLLADHGYGISAYPKENGGEDDMGKYMDAFHALSAINLNYAVKFGVQFGLFGGAIYQLGTERHHTAYLEDTGRCNILGCFCMTETGHGSNVKDIETTATYDHNDKSIVIHSPSFTAGKEYIGNALHGSYAVVFAQLIVKGENHGVHAVMVKYRNDDGTLIEGVEVKDCGDKLGLNGIDNGRVWFTNIKVGVENLLNKYGDIDPDGNYISIIENPNKRFFTMLGALVGGRICVGLGAISAAKKALAIAINYAHRRRQFKGLEEDEILLMDYPIHQHRLMPLLVKTIMYQNSLKMLQANYLDKEKHDIRKIETKAAGLKAMSTWLTSRAIQESREACGGKGYIRENLIADLRADADIFTTFEGDNNVLMQLVAKGLLTEFKESFNDDAFMSTMKYIGGKIGFTFSEYNFLSSRNTSSSHLVDDEFISDTLRYREKKHLVTLADRMNAYNKKNVNPHEAFLKSQVHMVDAAKAYIERLVYRNMKDRLNTLPDSPEKSVLDTICRFYGLTIIMDNRNFYLETDYMDGSKTKALRRVYSEQMAKVTALSSDIVKTFRLPIEMSEIKA
jgi:acyl-CoA oxidase